MHAFLEEVALHLVATYGDTLKDTAIVFNNKRPVAHLQYYLSKAVGKPFWSPAFFTVQEFFARSSDLKTADHFSQYFTLYTVYSRLLEEEGNTPVRPEVFYSVAQTILSDFAQIDNDLADADQVFAELEDIAVIQKQFQHLNEEQQAFLEQFWRSFSAGKQQAQQEHFIRMWRRMPRLYHQFHRELAAQGLSTSGNMYRQLAEDRPGTPHFARDFSKIILVGFNALSKAEAAVFKRWQEEARAVFYFDADAYYVDDPVQEAGLFLRRNMGQLQLRNELPAGRSPMKETAKKVFVYKAQGRAAQAKILHQALSRSYLALQDAGPSKVAVVLADESLLVPLLQTVPQQFPEDFGYPIQLNITMGYPLAASSVYGFADLWITVQEHLFKNGYKSVYHKEASAFLSHPLALVPLALQQELQAGILASQWIEVPVSALLRSSSIAELFFERPANPRQVLGILTALFARVLDSQLAAGLLKQLDADLLGGLIKELNRLNDTLGQHLPQVKDLSFLFGLVRKALSGLSVAILGEPLQGIQVMGLLESRSLDFEEIYIIGANEGVLPNAGISHSFIPDSIRRVYGLPVLENQDAISAYMFYRLLHRCKSLHLVYNGLSDEQNTGEPTRFLKQLEYESGFEFSYFEQQQTISPSRRIPFQVQKTGAVRERLERYLDAYGPFAKKLSATALTTYLNCQMQFFYRYVADVKEPDELIENMESNQIGSILHLVMENFYSPMKAQEQEVTAERIRAARRNLDDLCRRAFAEVIFNKADVPEGFSGMQQVILAIVKQYASVIIDHDEQIAPFTLVELENKEAYVLPYTVEVEGRPRKVNLYGIIDRVDRRNGITRIVDYKTGKDELRYATVAELFAQDTKKPNKAMVQTLFYTYIYEQVKGLRAVEPNLYVVRKMKEEGTLFSEGPARSRLLLEADQLQQIKMGFEAELQAKLAEMFSPDNPFRQTTVEENCTFCPYLTTCGK
ncbi:ATP-dependent nuclease subunit B [Pedobacter yulinensis]|uniref:ATP-dependent nuclease subunit B n=1 Tax=Pedobacter yulinensis TaxID=2126353 RepID=A0A2T3HR88_9SPHI|nr:PD-(D/E)XK nuclease family protein [Pedobacter yulinensis]PST84907.1 ATP-dependent nuclease subunit B [Pedobacter yulinensis]